MTNTQPAKIEVGMWVRTKPMKITKRMGSGEYHVAWETGQFGIFNSDLLEPLLITPPPDAKVVEVVAKALWHRFAPDHHNDWEDEPNQSEYRGAAIAALHAAGHIDAEKEEG